jgi:RimK family alpha-L-glutamate ligase
MKKGILIVNKFLNTPQVAKTYDMLLAGAKRAGIDMAKATNADFFVELDSGLVKADKEHSLEGIDFILFWNKDVFLGRALERMGYRLYNCADAIEACDNKALTFEMLQGLCRMPKTIKIPMTFNTIGYDDLSFEEKIGKQLGYPYVIKECLGSYGGQVYLADDCDKAREILKQIEGKDCLAQEFISGSRGRDLRAYVVGDNVVAAMERYNADDFRSNITNGGSAKAYGISEEQEKLAVSAAKGLGLDFAGVDILFGENDEPILCEVNSNAQFKGLLDATGTDITDALFEYIKNS